MGPVLSRVPNLGLEPTAVLTIPQIVLTIPEIVKNKKVGYFWAWGACQNKKSRV